MCAFLTAMVILTPNYNKMQVFYKGLCFYPVNIGIKKKKKLFPLNVGTKVGRQFTKSVKLQFPSLGEDFSGEDRKCRVFYFQTDFSYPV